MILKVIDSDGIPNPGAVADAVLYATDHHASIVNMSFEIYVICKSLEHNLKLRPDILFVVAAGNASKGTNALNLDGSGVQMYPAQYSKIFPNVVTVAAHDVNGKLALFSNWGEKTVDLAAPGESVESIQPGKTQILSGTSQAAPLVSFAAALLYASGVRGAVDIRQRLITSTEYDPDLKGKVRSAGRLNIAKALAVLRGDVVQLNTGELVCGKLLDRSDLQIYSLKSPLAFGQVRKIIFNYSKENPQKADLILSFNKLSMPDGLERFEQTLEDIFPLKIEQTNGNVRSIERSEVRDIVLHRPVQ